MITSETWRQFRASRPVRLTLFALGILLMVVTPAVAILPGPGGIFVFAAGLALALRNSDWAKRRYVHFKRWQPKVGAWADWGLRRASARRRDELRKAQERDDQPPPHCIERIDDPLPSSGFEIAPMDPTPGEVRPGASREAETHPGALRN
jgi:hypothetical protein